MSHDLRRTLAKLAVFLVFSLVLSSIVFSSLLNSSRRDQVGYAADFTNASGLRSGNAVRIAGVQVGRIKDVRLRGDHARVTFDLDDDQHPTTTTGAVINYQNLLGQRFVNLVPGAAAGEPMREGAVIPVERTQPGLDLTAVFDGFQPLFAALSPDEVNQLAGSIVQVFQGQSGTVESLFKQTAVITTDLADRQALVDSLLRNLAGLLDQVGSHDQQIGQLIDGFDALVTNLADDQQQLGDTVTGFSRLTTDVGSLLGQAQPALDSDIARLATVTGTLAQEQGALDGVVQGLPDLLATFAKPISSGSYLNAYLCNLSVRLRQPGVPDDSPTVPLVLSLQPGVPAVGPDGAPITPNPVQLPARTVFGQGAAGAEACQ